LLTTDRFGTAAGLEEQAFHPLAVAGGPLFKGLDHWRLSASFSTQGLPPSPREKMTHPNHRRFGDEHHIGGQ
jgi:hypothetical protein